MKRILYNECLNCKHFKPSVKKDFFDYCVSGHDYTSPFDSIKNPLELLNFYADVLNEHFDFSDCKLFECKDVVQNEPLKNTNYEKRFKLIHRKNKHVEHILRDCGDADYAVFVQVPKIST